MALRATNGPTQSTRSAKPGERVEFRAKIENTAGADESVTLSIEDAKPPIAYSFDPPAIEVPAKARKAIAFSWTAALPEGANGQTYRGKLVLRRTTDGALVGSAPLDLYVGR